ncbi:MAG: 3-isopropylmalate dehydrogenase [Deltaproteobacteria bacterium]|uniref:3-isopropylmalate dehydrogenase n=1 Tax=Candidatus Zymogenus saltonus TaxID=2844893 RepID=A0A9D8KAF4_9DELT|nr:3-isopropylmalate dehydrogenase [Candidatus Zymogenus saltonus]
MKRYKIALLPGDGVGVEVTREAVKVLNAVSDSRDASKDDIKFDFVECPVGGAAIDEYGVPLPEDTLDVIGKSSAVLLGAVGGPKWDGLPTDKRPEAALLKLRSTLGLFCNLRPAIVFPELVGASTIKEEVIRDIDIMVVRELTGGIYFGTPRGIRNEGGQRVGINTLSYSESEIRRIADTAFKIAEKRRKKLTSVDKANVLESMALWREVVSEVAKGYPDVTVEHMYVDNCAMQLIRRPCDFDTILTTNLFGDIISDEAAMLTGSIGMLPSASLGEVKDGGAGGVGMYEPVHGSAPDIAGRGVANPIASILSASMMLRYSLMEIESAEMIEGAVRRALADGLMTADIFIGEGRKVSTYEMGDYIAENIKTLNVG